MSNPPSMAASLPSQPPASTGLSASLLGGGGSDDPSKAALLALDADVVARAAQEHGRDAWSQMSWAERLAATRTHAGLGSRKGSAASKLPPAAPPSRKSSVASLAVSQRSRQSARPPPSHPPATPVAAAAADAPVADLLGSARGTPQSRPLSRHASVAGSASAAAQPPLAPLASQSSPAPTQPPGSADDLLADPPSPTDSAAAAGGGLSRRSSKLSRVASSAASAAASLLLPRRPSVAETTPLDRTLDAEPATPAAAPPATPVAAPGGCAGCDGLRAKVASLEASLKALKKQKAAKGGGAAAAAAAVGSSAEADALLVQELDLARAALGERTGELQAASAAAAAAAEEAAELRAQAEGQEDPDVLHAQVWTLEKALELRNEEIHSLRTKLNLFVEQIAELDERLASALRTILESTREEAERNEQGAFGTTADEAVEATAKKRRARKGKKGASASAAGAKAAALAAEVEGLQRANGALERRLEEALRGGSGGGQRERDAEVQRLHAQLEQAHQAILSGVDKGQDMRRDAERKLKETRKVLKNLLQSPEGGGGGGGGGGGLPAHGSVVVVRPCALDSSSPGPLTEQDILTADLPVWSPAALASSPRSPHYAASFAHLSSVPHAPAVTGCGPVLGSPTGGGATAPLSPAAVQAQVERLNLRHMVATQVGGGTCRSVSPTRASVPVRIL